MSNSGGELTRISAFVEAGGNSTRFVTLRIVTNVPVQMTAGMKMVHLFAARCLELRTLQQEDVMLHELT
eukprot:2436608-Pyramimonas_sp.AAC.1